jgi:hypothetical protein
VTSWRDSASETAQTDLDNLLNAVLPFATEKLDKHGEFSPFGAAVTTEGEIRLLAADPGDEQPPSQQVLDMLIAGAQSERESLRAVGLVSDVSLSEPRTDAVRAELEHSEGPAMAVHLPYKKKRLGRGIEYGSLMAAASERRVWSG